MHIPFETAKFLPDYKDQSAQSKTVISARIAEIQTPWMASAEHILVAWIPAIPRHSLSGAGSAGKTLLLKHLYNQEFLYRSGF
ncbi:hypothetical protein GO003_003405 [Methylicorpusculum oleiharenae]|uniref:hypothetical protein n=1 Tax=Methylicorpusculum oleiharenae TaxID=1338687 RepID=UPI00135AB56C|nr:hypothetical protein [Methylicorpusculum oleiharenae]MCD2449435.1 hypothetical protein [Methylicorpusculum oleiharenae]